MNSNEAVPIIITHRTVTRMPKVNVKKRFVGIKDGLLNLAIKAIELVQENFWVEESDVEDKGESRVVHYAIDVEDDSMEPEKALLIATKLHGNDRPGCGAHFEVVKVLDEKPIDDSVIRMDKNAKYSDRLGKAKLSPDRPKPGDEPKRTIKPQTRFGINLNEKPITKENPEN